MKKAAIIIAVLSFVLLGGKIAFAQFVDYSDLPYTSMDVKIIERTKNCPCCTEQTLEYASEINETLNNLKPGDEVNLSYKIVNTGHVDIILDSMDFSTDNGELGEFLNIEWTITQYENDIPTNELSGDASSKKHLDDADIHLHNNNTNNCYCILELNITFDNDCEKMSVQSQQTTFKLTPTFHQQ